VLALDDARSRLLARVRQTDGERVALADAHGRVLVAPSVAAQHDVPPFANSAMDGWAVRAADLPASLEIAGEAAAGAATLPEVRAGTAVRIMTGAPLPPGADAVVQLELADEDGSRVRLPAVEAGTHVRPAGGDTRRGAAITLSGPIGPGALAVLATLGVGTVEVRRRPRVAILSSGDELAEPGATLGPGQIHDANTVALAAAVREAGGEALSLPRVADDADAVEVALLSAARDADLVVTSGGVSVGRHDHVRAVLERRGTVDFWRIAVQPGKPLLVADLDGTTVIGLPGNPVSALVTFELFARPFIRAALGMAGDGRRHLLVTMRDAVEKDPDRCAFLRVAVDARLEARSAGGQGSAQVRPLAATDALLIVPIGVRATIPGERYEAILIGEGGGA
jgi:molybdopterin molybdotransferase